MAAGYDPRPAALALAEAWREGAPISALPSPPRTRVQAERVAFGMLAELDLAAVGFRAVARDDGTILTGPLVESRLLESGVSVPAALHAGQARGALFAPLATALPGGRGAIDWPTLATLLGRPRAALDLAAVRVAGDDAVHDTADLARLGLIVLSAPRRNAAADPGALRVVLERGVPATDDRPLPDPPPLRARGGAAASAPSPAHSSSIGQRRVREGVPLTLKATLDARPLLLAAANAARRAGGLPQGAALCVALPLAVPAAGARIACRITGLGEAAAILV
jgi:hypothetical protein